MMTAYVLYMMSMDTHIFIGFQVYSRAHTAKNGSHTYPTSIQNNHLTRCRVQRKQGFPDSTIIDRAVKADRSSRSFSTFSIAIIVSQIFSAYRIIHAALLEQNPRAQLISSKRNKHTATFPTQQFHTTHDKHQIIAKADGDKLTRVARAGQNTSRESKGRRPFPLDQENTLSMGIAAKREERPCSSLRAARKTFIDTVYFV